MFNEIQICSMIFFINFFNLCLLTNQICFIRKYLKKLKTNNLIRYMVKLFSILKQLFSDTCTKSFLILKDRSWKVFIHKFCKGFLFSLFLCKNWNRQFFRLLIFGWSCRFFIYLPHSQSFRCANTSKRVCLFLCSLFACSLICMRHIFL